MVSISVVIPVYNSADCIEACAERIAKVLSEFEYEILLVNDQSPDNSWNVLKKLANTNKNIKIINLLKNAGQDNAIMAGLKHSQNDFVVIMDDDLQHAPEDIVLLLNESLKKDLDVCYAKFPKLKQAVWKKWGSWLNGKVSEYYLGKKKGVYLSPYKILHRRVVNEIVKYEGGFPYIDAIILSLTANYDEVSIEHHERFAGKGNYNLRRSLSVFAKMFFSYSILPLRLASVLGFIIFVISCLLGLLLLFLFFFGESGRVEGWTSLMIVTLFIGSLNLLFMGIIGEYLGRSYLKINYYPQYVIKESMNLDKEIAFSEVRK